MAAAAARTPCSVDELAALLRGRTIAVLSGAGLSTESGIPDYRGPGTRARARNPIRFQEYAASATGRARYWARAMVGWPRFCAAQPNAGHTAIARLEAAGVIVGVITQNVDRLHQRAGSRGVIELHGALHDVRCLDCGARCERADVQARLEAANPGLVDRTFELAPDGDAELPPDALAGFEVPACEHCGGVLKPDVVFFGESVAPDVVARAYALVDASDALLVVGSSLVVFSGYRFVRRAHDRGRDVAIVNLGATRGDAYARAVIDGATGIVLPQLAAALVG
jgi:NAD-dependent SIR2 family protein deacetylase